MGDRKMQIKSVRVHPLVRAAIIEAATAEGVSESQYMRDSAWAMALRPDNPAVEEWLMMQKVVRALGWEAVYAALTEATE